MAKNSSTKTQGISNSQISGAQLQFGQAERDLEQTQQSDRLVIAKQEIATKAFIEGLNQIADLLKESNLPDTRKTEATNYLNAATQEIQQPEPDKELIAKNLKRMGDTLKTANDTVEAGKGLWEKIQPMLLPLVGWLGTARSFLGF